MNVASIDIGSNTVLLLIVEIEKRNQSIKTILNEVRIPRIYQGINKTLNISDEKIKLLIDILNEYNEIISHHDCIATLITATKAFRVAQNSNLIIGKIKSVCNLQIEVITGEKEAQLSYLGSTFPWIDNENKYVIDIGGGSTELIYGNRSEIHSKISFDFGVVSLTEEFFQNYPPSKNEICQLELFLAKKLIDINLEKTNYKVIAVAGTPTILSCINQGLKQFNEPLIDNSRLSLNVIEHISIKLSQLTKDEIFRSYGSVVIGREDLLLSGSLILKTFMHTLGVNEITVSTKGLRYGVIIDYLQKLNWNL
jgi:exopolyphosphatase/guanosine-5'-triphosphate,3'-diphosphate pyrophosphatase